MILQLDVRDRVIINHLGDMLKFDETASYSFMKETALIADIKGSSVAAQYQYVHSICHFLF